MSKMGLYLHTLCPMWVDCYSVIVQIGCMKDIPSISAQIDEEVMRIKSKSGQRLHVERGEYGTVAVPHDIDVQINAITIQDDAYVEANLDEDDFGFGETITDYVDGNVFSTSQNRDVET